MENTVDYKAFHEKLTSNNNGTAPLENVLVILPSVIGVDLALLFRTLMATPQNRGAFTSASFFLIDFVCLIMPCILTFTVLADHTLLVLTTLFVCCCLGRYVRLITMKKSSRLVPMEYLHRRTWAAVMNSEIPQKQRPLITIFRSITNLLTVLSILAVDFHIFPRRFAKTETFGFGVMDLGVGLFIVSNAFVAPETRARSLAQSSFWKSLLQSMPLMLLGCGRIIATSLADYQEHITEYGRHWNFFFTLAVTKLLCSSIVKIVNHSTKTYIILSAALVVSYEIVLLFGLREWIFSDAPRTGFFAANREGLASCIGYIALYFGGVALGRELFKWKKLDGSRNVSDIMKFTAVMLTFWIATLICEQSTGVSRRLANMGYVLWILSFTTTYIVALLILELFLLHFNILCNNTNPLNMVLVPDLTEAINKNGLFYFLLGNLLTGLVNMNLNTFLVGNLYSLTTLTLYMFTNCVVVSILHYNNITLKL